MSKERSSQNTMKRLPAGAQVRQAGGQRGDVLAVDLDELEIGLRLALPSPSSRRTSACAAFTSDDLPMPRAPHSSALLAGRPRAKRRVLSSSCSAARSMPLSRPSGWRLTCATARKRFGRGLPHEGLAHARNRPWPAAAAPAARGLRQGAPGARGWPSRRSSRQMASCARLAANASGRVL